MAQHRIYTMSFASVYPMYVAKAEKKKRTKAEVDEVIRWLTGYTAKGLVLSKIKEESVAQVIPYVSGCAIESALLITHPIDGVGELAKLEALNTALSNHYSIQNQKE